MERQKNMHLLKTVLFAALFLVAFSFVRNTDASAYTMDRYPGKYFPDSCTIDEEYLDKTTDVVLTVGVWTRSDSRKSLPGEQLAEYKVTIKDVPLYEITTLEPESIIAMLEDEDGNPAGLDVNGYELSVYKYVPSCYIKEELTLTGNSGFKRRGDSSEVYFLCPYAAWVTVMPIDGEPYQDTSVIKSATLILMPKLISPQFTVKYTLNGRERSRSMTSRIFELCYGESKTYTAEEIIKVFLAGKKSLVATIKSIYRANDEEKTNLWDGTSFELVIGEYNDYVIEFDLSEELEDTHVSKSGFTYEYDAKKDELVFYSNEGTKTLYYVQLTKEDTSSVQVSKFKSLEIKESGTALPLNDATRGLKVSPGKAVYIYATIEAPGSDSAKISVSPNVFVENAYSGKLTVNLNYIGAVPERYYSYSVPNIIGRVTFGSGEDAETVEDDCPEALMFSDDDGATWHYVTDWLEMPPAYEAIPATIPEGVTVDVSGISGLSDLPNCFCYIDGEWYDLFFDPNVFRNDEVITRFTVAKGAMTASDYGIIINKGSAEVSDGTAICFRLKGDYKTLTGEMIYEYMTGTTKKKLLFAMGDTESRRSKSISLSVPLQKAASKVTLNSSSGQL